MNALRRWWDREHELRAFLLQYGEALPAASSGAIVHRLYESRPDLRAAFPWALTPLERPAFAAWLMEQGRREVGLDVADVAGFWRESMNDRSYGLATTWLLSPEHQLAVPNALMGDWQGYARWLRAREPRLERWLKKATPRVQSWPAPGVNLLGHFRYPSGLQQVAEQYALAFAGLGGVSRRDAPLGLSRWDSAADLLGPEVYDITVAPLGACESFDAQYPLVGWAARPGVYRIASWAWELDAMPRAIAGAATLAQEIWTLSEFSAKAMRQAFPEKAVRAMLPAVSVPRSASYDRRHFGLPPGFLVLFAFDMASVMERKNPLGLIAAFKLAFGDSSDVHLAMKISRAETAPENLAKLRTALPKNATIIDRMLSREEQTGLMACADAYASLHRAEGLGYTIAEAMLLNVPTVATAYSANVEYCPAEHYWPVPYELVPIGPGLAPYPADGQWAEPSVQSAAEQMRAIRNQPSTAKSKAEQATRAVSGTLSVAALQGRLAARIAEIRAGKTRDSTEQRLMTDEIITAWGTRR
jgi:glycosyltransferase involved in cell wall biosynthesis